MQMFSPITNHALDLSSRRRKSPITSHQSPVTNSGFTFIELLIVIVIMALLFGVGYAGYRGFQARQGIVNVTRKIKIDLRLAQEYALSQRKLCPNTTDILIGYKFEVTPPNSYKINALCDDGVGACDDGVGACDVGPDIKVESFSGYDLSTTPNRYILFRVLGRGARILPGNDTQVTINIVATNPPATSSIIVTSGGQIR